MTGIRIVATLDANRHSQMDVMGIDGISATLDTMHEQKRVAIHVITPDRIDKRQNGRRFKENGAPAFTLTAQDRHGVEIGVQTEETQDHPGLYVQLSEECTVYCVWYKKEGCYIAIRKLTPRECFRLQGWTDEYYDNAAFVNSDSQLYRQAVNGVTVPVIEAMAKKMKLFEKRE